MKRFLSMTALLASSAAGASALDYSYLQVGYGGEAFADDLVVGSVAFRGIRGPVINGSYQIDDRFFVGGGFLRFSDSLGSTSLTSTQFGVDAGAAFQVGERVDLVVDGQLSSSRSEVCIGVCATVDDTVTGVSLGIRAMPTSAFEIGAKVGLASADKGGSSSFVGLSLRGWFDGHSAIGLALSGDDDSNRSAVIDYRYTF